MNFTSFDNPVLTVRRLLASVGAGLVLVGSLAGATIAASPSPMASHGQALSSFDQAFIDMMVPHHQSAVAMAVVALARAEHPEIAALAPEIIEAQEPEIGAAPDLAGKRGTVTLRRRRSPRCRCSMV